MSIHEQSPKQENFPSAPHIVDSVGSLDVVILEREQLHIEGWVASLDAGALTSLELMCGGRAYHEFELTTGITSPDVAQTYPHLANAGNCRFKLVLSRNSGKHLASPPALVQLTPVFGEQHGCVMSEIALPLSLYENKSSISTNLVATKFKAASYEFLGYFIQLAGLMPGENILDVGCGGGRMAYSLAYYLKHNAKYCGFDISASMIDWCQKNITAKFPNFQFQKADLFNRNYNPSGKEKAAEFRFPYEDGVFDFVFLTSIFTHMPGNEVMHYLDEIYRVLKPGGRCLCTMFLINDEAQDLIEEKRSSQNLVYRLQDFFTTKPELPEFTIGYEESLILKWISERNFRIGGKYYGHWCGRTRPKNYQDMLVIYK